jgi:hypothetical protein
MIKRIALVLALITLSSTSSFAADAEMPALVKEYIKVTPVREAVEDALSSAINPQKTAAGESKVKALIAEMDLNKIQAAIEKSLTAHYTPAELRAAIVFITMPAGKSFLNKQFLLSRDITPAIAAELEVAFQKVLEKESHDAPQF